MRLLRILRRYSLRPCLYLWFLSKQLGAWEDDWQSAVAITTILVATMELIIWPEIDNLAKKYL